MLDVVGLTAVMFCYKKSRNKKEKQSNQMALIASSSDDNTDESKIRDDGSEAS
jgi:hypothetical protein